MIQDMKISTLLYFLSHVHRYKKTKLRYMKTNYERTKILIDICIRKDFLEFDTTTQSYNVTKDGYVFLNELRGFIQ